MEVNIIDLNKEKREPFVSSENNGHITLSRRELPISMSLSHVFFTFPEKGEMGIFMHCKFHNFAYLEGVVCSRIYTDILK
jgi:hypothetical protein